MKRVIPQKLGRNKISKTRKSTICFLCNIIFYIVYTVCQTVSLLKLYYFMIWFWFHFCMHLTLELILVANVLSSQNAWNFQPF